MKKVFFIAAIIGASAVFTGFKTSNITSKKPNVSLESDYCQGWADGYCEGWKDVKGSFALCPLTPLCPLPELFKDRYKDGYNRGFKAGSIAAQNQ
jgi:hypothetical protein